MLYRNNSSTGYLKDFVGSIYIRTLLIRYQVSGIFISPGELLAWGYCTQHPEDKTSYKSENKTLRNEIWLKIEQNKMEIEVVANSEVESMH